MLPEDTLLPLGFTETEALAYCELLRSGAGTGYRVAQGIGKAQANTYKTLATLVQKGAVIDDGGDPKVFRAVAPDEMMGALKDRLATQTEVAAEALKRIAQHEPEHRLFQMRAPDQVWQRAETMIAQAREVILFDCFPPIEARLADSLAAAARRGVKVCGIVYEDYAGRPADYQVVVSKNAGDVVARWPGAELKLCVDASQELLALFSHDLKDLKQGLCSDSIYLSVHLHYALAAEIRLHHVIEAEGGDAARLSISGQHPPGLRALLTQGPAPDPSPIPPLHPDPDTP